MPNPPSEFDISLDRIRYDTKFPVPQDKRREGRFWFCEYDNAISSPNERQRAPRKYGFIIVTSDPRNGPDDMSLRVAEFSPGHLFVAKQFRRKGFAAELLLAVAQRFEEADAEKEVYWFGQDYNEESYGALKKAYRLGIDRAKERNIQISEEVQKDYDTLDTLE